MAFNFAFYCNVCKIKAKKKGQEIEIKKGKECQRGFGMGWGRGETSSNRKKKCEASERERERKARLRGRVCSRYKHSCTSTCYNNNNNITQTVSEWVNAWMLKAICPMFFRRLFCHFVYLYIWWHLFLTALQFEPVWTDTTSANDMCVFRSMCLCCDWMCV